MKTNTYFQIKNEEFASTADSLIKPRSIKELIKDLDEPKRFVMVVILDTLSVINRHLKYCPPLARPTKDIADPKPLAAIRWFLTDPNGGKLLADSLEFSIWQSYYDKLKPLLERAEAINPHLTSYDDEYYASYDASKFTDNDTFDDLITSESVVPVIQTQQPARIPPANLTFPFYDLHPDSNPGNDGNSRSDSPSAKKRLSPQNTLHRLQSASDNFTNNSTNDARTVRHTFVQTELFPDFISNPSSARRSK